MPKRTLVLLAIIGLGIAVFAWGIAKKPAENPNRLDTEFVRQSQHYDEQVQAEMDAIWERIEHFVESRHPGFLAKLPPPATDEEILHLEETIGFQLPGDFKASLKRHAKWIEFFSDYSLLSVPSIEKMWLSNAEWAAVYPNVVRIDCGGWHPGFFPFARYDAYETCIDIETGEIVTVESGSYVLDTEAKSFRVWLLAIADRLEVGEFSFRDSEGKPVYDLLSEDGAYSLDGLQTPGSTVPRTSGD